MSLGQNQNACLYAVCNTIATAFIPVHGCEGSAMQNSELQENYVSWCSQQLVLVQQCADLTTVPSLAGATRSACP